jgi:hypothetical protein
VQGAHADDNPWSRGSFEPLTDCRKRSARNGQRRFGRWQRNLHLGHQRPQPIDRVIMEVALIDSRIGDEQRLSSQAKTNTLGDPGERSSDSRPQGSVQHPHCLKTFLPQQP